MKSNQENLGYEPAERELSEAKAATNSISSHILDWMEVKGNTTESGARVSMCEKIDPDFEKYYAIHHSWSVYALKSGSFDEAMSNLRKQLPEEGWEITKDGATNSRAKNPVIVAHNPENHHVVKVEWRKKRSGDLKQLISVNVDSRCYKARQSADLSHDR